MNKRIKQTAHLENWTRFQGCLTGTVSGHPGHEDGTEVKTSTVMSPPDLIKEGGTIETRNTIYTLGTEYKLSTDKGNE